MSLNDLDLGWRDDGIVVPVELMWLRAPFLCSDVNTHLVVSDTEARDELRKVGHIRNYINRGLLLKVEMTT